MSTLIYNVVKLIDDLKHITFIEQVNMLPCMCYKKQENYICIWHIMVD